MTDDPAARSALRKAISMSADIDEFNIEIADTKVKSMCGVLLLDLRRRKLSSNLGRTNDAYHHDHGDIGGDGGGGGGVKEITAVERFGGGIKGVVGMNEYLDVVEGEGRYLSLSAVHDTTKVSLSKPHMSMSEDLGSVIIVNQAAAAASPVRPLIRSPTPKPTLYVPKVKIYFAIRSNYAGDNAVSQVKSNPKYTNMLRSPSAVAINSPDDLTLFLSNTIAEAVSSGDFSRSLVRAAIDIGVPAILTPDAKDYIKTSVRDTTVVIGAAIIIDAPTSTPTTNVPTSSPTLSPVTSRPTKPGETNQPTSTPSSSRPTRVPTSRPSSRPTSQPTRMPTVANTDPTSIPTIYVPPPLPMIMGLPYVTGLSVLIVMIIVILGVAAYVYIWRMNIAKRNVVYIDESSEFSHDNLPAIFTPSKRKTPIKNPLTPIMSITPVFKTPSKANLTTGNPVRLSYITGDFLNGNDTPTSEDGGTDTGINRADQEDGGGGGQLLLLGSSSSPSSQLSHPSLLLSPTFETFETFEQSSSPDIEMGAMSARYSSPTSPMPMVFGMQFHQKKAVDVTERTPSKIKPKRIYVSETDLDAADLDEERKESYDYFPTD